VAELPLKTQVKLLRFLQEGSFEKVGGEKKISVDVRIISATNKDLTKEVRANRFREDLYYRLNVIPIHLPPLRERKNDIPLLAEHFLREAEKENKKSVPELAPDTIRAMMDYHWPGNVRELKNVIQFAVVRSRGNVIMPTDLPFVSNRQPMQPVLSNESAKPGVQVTRGKLNQENVQAALVKTGGNKSKAARVLGVGRATLYRFLGDHPEIKAFSDTF
jgi:DNA-binding NtrC family response regulator